MRFSYIGHAPTRVSATGKMVENYDSYGIIPFDRDKWWKEVGCHLPEDFILLVSPITRCIETAEVLFPDKEYRTLESLREFDCSKLGDKKFWDTKSMTYKHKMTNVFIKQVDDLELLVPNFKIASAIIHYDETSPHLHIVGVPIKYKNKNG